MTPHPPADRHERVWADVGLMLMTVVWAVNFTIAKIALGELSPLAFNALRFPFASLAVLIAFRWYGPTRRPSRTDWARLALLAVLGNVAYQLLFIFGLDRARAGTASLLLAGTPMMTAVLSALSGHERISRAAWLGVAATVVGMVIVAGEAVEPGSTRSGGALLLLGASVSWAVYTVYARPLVQRFGAIPVTAWTLWIGTGLLVAIGLPDLLDVRLTEVSLGAWLAVFYAGALSIGLAYMLWYNGVRVVGNTRTATYSNLVPVIAVLTAWIWLGDQPGLREVVGAVVIIGGVTLTRIHK